jgi:leader peptidase (prepilin peptidase) / N-methyltransferase
MNHIVWTLVGLFFGWRAHRLALRDIAELRYQHTTFGEAHFTQRRLSATLCVLAGGALWWALSQRLEHDITVVVFGMWSALLVRVFLVDIDTHVVARRTVVGGTVLGFVGLSVASVWDNTGSVLQMLWGAAVLWLALKILALISRGDLGAGDVSLGPLLGLFTGWLALERVFIALVAAFLIGGLYAIALVTLGRASRRTFIAFGPFLVLGAFVGVLR